LVVAGAVVLELVMDFDVVVDITDDVVVDVTDDVVVEGDGPARMQVQALETRAVEDEQPLA